MTYKRIALAISLFVVMIMPAYASSVIFTDNLTVWLSSVQGITTLDFEGIAPTGSFVGYGTNPFVIGGVTFQASSPGTQAFVVDPGYEPTFYDWGSGALLNFDYGAPNSLTATLPAGTYGVGFDVMTFGPYAGIVSVEVSGAWGTASASLPTLNYPNRAFVGVISTDPISSILFSASTQGVNIDNFRFGTAVPEPASLLLLGTGLGTLVLAAWRRKK